MAKGSYFLVWCPDATTIDDAERALRRTTMTVTRDGDQLVARRGTGPELYIGINDDETVRIEAEDVAERHGVDALAACARRFEVSFDDLEKVADETNTLFEVGASLQDLAQGYIVYAWNGRLLMPDGSPCTCKKCGR
jgi:hypothetical protein